MHFMIAVSLEMSDEPVFFVSTDIDLALRRFLYALSEEQIDRIRRIVICRKRVDTCRGTLLLQKST